MFSRPSSILRFCPDSLDLLDKAERFRRAEKYCFLDGMWNSEVVSSASLNGANFTKTEFGQRLQIKIPGIDPEFLEIEVKRDELTLRSTQEANESTSNRRYLKRERELACLNRRYKFGFSLDPERVKASYTNGILEVDIPKLEAEIPIAISVSVH